MRTCPECGNDYSLDSDRCRKCGTQSPPLPAKSPVNPGVFLGKTYRYQIESRIAKDSFSDLWLAKDLKSRRAPVELKIIHTDLSCNSGNIYAFRKFSLIMIPHKHPNLKRVLSFEYDDTFAFFITEHVKGPDLSEYAKERDILTEDEILWVIREICTGLNYIHKIGFCHGDLKIDNISLAKKPIETLPTIATARSFPHQCVKISDWILSSALASISRKDKEINPSRWKISDDMMNLARIIISLTRAEDFQDEITPENIPSDLSELIQKIILMCIKETDNDEESKTDEIIKLIEDTIE